MAMGIHRGVSNVARKVKKEWRGVGNVARQIKAEWRGVGNVARKVFQNELVLFDNGKEPNTTITAWNGTSKGSNKIVSNSNVALVYLNLDPIDISGYTKICFTGYTSASTTSGTGSLLRLRQNSDGAYAYTKRSSAKHTTTSSTISFDISDYGYEKIGGICFSPSGSIDYEGDWSRSNVTSYVTKIWLE